MTCVPRQCPTCLRWFLRIEMHYRARPSHRPPRVLEVAP